MKSFSAFKKDHKAGLEYWTESSKLDFMISVNHAMASNKITKKDLADLISCTPAYISKVLRGDANFTIETMVKISRALGSKLCIQLVPENESIQWVGVVLGRRSQLDDRPHRQWASSKNTSNRRVRVLAHG